MSASALLLSITLLSAAYDHAPSGILCDSLMQNRAETLSELTDRRMADAVGDSVVALQQILVEAKVKPISVRGDTLVYAVPAFTTHEGERLRTLLKDVPGIDVLADGTIKARGRVVDRLLLNGHELLGLGVASVIDNLPASYLQSILLYDDACSREKETGVYEGATEQVIDLITTEENRSAWLNDVSAGGGTEKRYSANASAAHYNDAWQQMFTATLDNLPSTFGIGESFYDKLQRTTGTADMSHHNLNASLSWQNKSWRVQASAFYDGSHRKDDTSSLMEAFLKSHSSRTESRNYMKGDTKTANAQLSLTWQDNLWVVHIDPIVTWNKASDKNRHSVNTFSDNVEVNSSNGYSQTNDDILSASLRASVNRKLGERGRNIDIRTNVRVQRQTTSQNDYNEVFFVKSTELTSSRRLCDGHDDSNSAGLSVAYIEPLGERFKLKAEYSFGYSTQTAEHPVQLSEGGQITFSDSLSRNAHSRNTKHRASLSIQYKYQRLCALLGVLIEDNRTHTVSDRYRFNIDTVRSTFDWCPELSLHYTGSRGVTITVSYGGRTRQPSIFDMLQGDDTSNPLNIRRGNPGLRVSFVHQVRLSLSHFAPKRQCQFNIAVGFDVEQWAITDRIFYDAKRGLRYYQPDNVNGNRLLIGSWGLQSNLSDTDRVWIDLQGDYQLSRVCGYQIADYTGSSPSQNCPNLSPEAPGNDRPYDQRYATIQSRVMQYLGLQCRMGYFSLKPYGYFRYDHTSSNLTGAIHQNVFIFGYGAIARYEHPKGFSASADCYEHCRRGFIDSVCNVSQLILDAEVAYAFLRNRSAEIRVIACDILRRRDLVEGTITQVGRTESRGSSAVNSYYMATITYRF